jgi:sialate O-acetylesterase
VPENERWLGAIRQAKAEGKPEPEAPSILNVPNVTAMPAGLYNGMISPLAPFAVRGAIWYQGESNTWRAFQYRKLLKSVIQGWREAWGQKDFYFLTVQLANWEGWTWWIHDWSSLREAQSMSLTLLQTGLAVTIDIGDSNDIHAKNKQEVGRRLALSALAKTYGQNITGSGPLYKSMSIENDKIRIHFDNVGKGLVAKDGSLQTFMIAGRPDQQFVQAQAKIEGDTVVVWSPEVPKPIAVRYAWATNPIGCNLYNFDGLPASPFRTDDWLCLTDNTR